MSVTMRSIKVTSLHQDMVAVFKPGNLAPPNWVGFSRRWFWDELEFEKLWSYWPHGGYLLSAAALPDPTTQYTPFRGLPWPQNRHQGQRVVALNLAQTLKYLHAKYLGTLDATVQPWKKNAQTNTNKYTKSTQMHKRTQILENISKIMGKLTAFLNACEANGLSK